MTKTLHLYVIGESDAGPVKLGFAENPAKRLGELQIGNPRELNLYYSIACVVAYDVEAWLHRRFQPQVIRGEWYDASAGEAVGAITQALILVSNGQLSRFARTPNLREANGVIERLCAMCGKWQILSHFSPARNRKHGTQVRCKTCAFTYQQEYRRRPEVRERHNAAERRRKRRMRQSRSGSAMQATFLWEK